MRLADLIAPNPPATSATSATQQALKGEMSQKSQVSQGVERENGFCTGPIPESLDTALTQACQQHGLDADAIRAELVDAGDWDDLNPAALRCFIRCKAQERRNLEALSLADKLKAYGRPYPLQVDGRTVCWLVPDEAAKRAHTGPEPCYTASEVETLAQAAPDEVRGLHALRERFTGTIRPVARETPTEQREGLPIVRCRDCQHWTADAINPVAGLGACAVRQRFGQDEPPPFPNAPRRCRKFEAQS